MSAASLRAGTMTVMEGEPVGEMLCWGRRRLGMRGRPKAAAMTFQSQVRAMSQARDVSGLRIWQGVGQNFMLFQMIHSQGIGFVAARQ